MRWFQWFPGGLFDRASAAQMEALRPYEGVASRQAPGGHPILLLSREKVRKNKMFKNNELKTGPLFRNTSPSESVHGFLFGFDESLAHNELRI